MNNSLPTYTVCKRDHKGVTVEIHLFYSIGAARQYLEHKTADHFIQYNDAAMALFQEREQSHAA